MQLGPTKLLECCLSENITNSQYSRRREGRPCCLLKLSFLDWVVLTCCPDRRFYCDILLHLWCQLIFSFKLLKLPKVKKNNIRLMKVLHLYFFSLTLFCTFFFSDLFSLISLWYLILLLFPPSWKLLSPLSLGRLHWRSSYSRNDFVVSWLVWLCLEVPMRTQPTAPFSKLRAWDLLSFPVIRPFWSTSNLLSSVKPCLLSPATLVYCHPPFL